MKDSRSSVIAFLFPAFPVLHQTFVLWEVLQLREQGIRIQLHSIKRPSTATQQPEGAAIAREVHYLPRTLSAPVLGANLKALLRLRGRYLAAFARLGREWWRDRVLVVPGHDEARLPSEAHMMLTPRQQLLRFFNRSDFTYLLKSLWLVLRAVYLGYKLQAAGIERVHAHWASYSATVALVIRWVFGIPFSLSAHAYDIYVVPRLLPVKLRMAEFTVTCAQHNAKYLRLLAGAPASERILVNYHGVDLQRFRPRDGTRPACGEPPRVVTCGRLQWYKGHDVLLRACAKLRTPVRCVLIGEGPHRENFERLADELGIRDRVEFTGPLPQSEVARQFAEADVFVAAGVLLGAKERRDVIPNVVAEAMAMQVPVVASDISGLRELVTDGLTGRLVPQGDVDALAAVLDELLDDEPQRRRLGLAGRLKVAADFDRLKNIQALVGLFRARSTHQPVGWSSGDEGPARRSGTA